MNKICIGIHVTDQAERLHATLESLQSTVSQAEVILLADGPDARTTETLSKIRHIAQFGTDERLGAPACFNQLARHSDAGILVLLEAGARVAPRCLDHLIAALDADPANGLAGPSTNLAWNEQAAFSHGGGTPGEVASTGREAERRFGSEWRTLEPLYSLADFCYAVRREVIACIGAADEAYKTGPCWEMDYNIRAARAGWRGAWACAAYVHRTPSTPQRRLDQTRRFEASKRLYQDRFCALKLRGEQAGYESHCKGDECEHFAPASIIRLKIPFPGEITPAASAASASISVAEAARSTKAPYLNPESSLPLVTCVMPTRDRAEFVLQSIAYFERQDYPARELIIIDDGREGLEGKLPDDPRIRYIQLSRAQSIGAKRNLGCDLARGSIVAHWDDDDWYASERLSVQTAPLIAAEAEITALEAEVFFDLPRWEFWRCTPELHRRLFCEDVHGGTLVYLRRVWEKFARYPDRSLAEDAGFLRQVIRRGARLGKLRTQGLFIYVRHSTNSWTFSCGEFLDGSGWLRVPEVAMPALDRAFYASRTAAGGALESAGVPPGSRAPTCLASERGSRAVHTGETPALSGALPAGPFVSCIMPTYNRRPYVLQAIGYFLRQSYINSELLVVDDGTDTIEDLIPEDPRVRYVHLAAKTTIGAKRNLACEQARGEMIVHWDDDDWIAGWRLGYQVESMIKSGADLCGLDKPLFYDPRADRAWEYVYPRGARFWVAGSTLCYTRAFWRTHPFPNINVGEDTRFVWGAPARRMLALENPGFFVAIIHSNNTSVKRTSDARYRPKSPVEVRSLIGGDLSFYAEMARTGAACA